MSRLSRFPACACSVLARRSDVGGRAACQKRGDWSRPAVGSLPIRLHSAITAGTDPAAQLPLLAAPSVARLAHVQRTQSAPSLPDTPSDCACRHVNEPGHGPGLQAGRRAATLRSTGGTSALGPSVPSRRQRSRTAAGEGEARSAARGPGLGMAWSSGPSAETALADAVGAGDAGRRTRRDGCPSRPPITKDASSPEPEKSTRSLDKHKSIDPGAPRTSRRSRYATGLNVERCEPAPASCRDKRGCAICSPSASRWPPGISTTKSRRPHG